MRYGRRPQSLPQIPGGLRGFRGGDEVVFTTLVRIFTPRLERYIQHFLTDADDVADAVQETWCRAYVYREQLRDPRAFPLWLFRICRTVCLSFRERSARRRALRWRIAHDVSSWKEVDGEPDETDRSSALRTQLRAVRDGLSLLSERQRRVIRLRFCENRPTSEVAQLLGCAEATVRATLHQALHRLRSLVRSQME